MMSALVAVGDRRASPRWTVRMASSSSSGWAFLPRKPLAPARRASKTYVSRLLTKLDARDRAQLVIAAYESGLVTPGRASA